MVQQVLQRFGFTYSSPLSTPLLTGHSFSAPPSDESVEPSGPYPELVGCLMYLMTCTRPDLAYPLSLLARCVAPGRHRKVHWDAVKRVLRYLCSTSGMGLVLGGRARVVLTGHADTSWVDDLATQRSSQGYTFSLGSGSFSWRSTRSSFVLSSSCEAEIYAGAMAAQELRWLTYLLTDLGEAPRSPPVLYVDNKAMLALCQEHRLEHITKHIALRYFLARELQQRGQLRLTYVASQANTADVFTKALQPCDHQHFCTVLGLTRSSQQLRKRAVRWGSLGGGAWGATTGSTCESTPTGSAAGRRGGSGGGQQQQQRSPQTLSPQQLREWAVRWGSPSGGGFGGTRTGGVEAPCGVEAASLGAFDSASAGVEPEDALHTFTLDSGASRCFFRDSTIVTLLTAPVPVTLADPSSGPVVTHGATVLPCPAALFGLLTGLHLPSFAKILVATSVLHYQWVTVTQPGGELVAICKDSRTGEHLATFTRRPGSGLYTLTTESALVAESGQVAATVEVAASCSCRLPTHHSPLAPPSLPPLSRSLAPPCLPCVEGRQLAAPQSSFPPTTAPLQTLHMDVWGPARVTGQGGERYFLVVVDNYTRYTTVFPLQSKLEVRSVLIRWIRAVRLELSDRFWQDLPVLRLHSD
ncbi:unnamed protein product [Closterium sp. NIES-54]